MPSKPRNRSTNYIRAVTALRSHPGASCAHCGRRDRPLEVDHVRALALGGTDDLRNLQLLCRPCHRAKTRRQELLKPSPRTDNRRWP